MNQNKKFLLSSLFLVSVLGALGAGCGSLAESGKDDPTRKLLQTIAQGDPSGVISSDPAGIQCSTECATLFAQGTQVTLTATPDSGWDFGGWQGACTGAEPTCSVTMSESKEVFFSFKRHFVPDNPPAAVNDAVTVQEDSGVTAVDVLANDPDPDGGPKQVSAVTQPTHGTVVLTGNGTGVTYAPSANYNGPDTFTYTLNGGSVGTVTVTVVAVDDPPTAVNDTAKVFAGSAATSIDVLANDTDIDGGPETIIAVTQPTNGSVVITGNGTGLTFQPNVGAIGNDTFTYTLNGGSTATVTVTVEGQVSLTAAPSRR